MANPTAPHPTGPSRSWRLLQSYAYADRPFDAVWPLLVSSPELLFGDDDEIPTLLPLLHATLAGWEVSRSVRITRGGFVDDDDGARVALRWEDARHPNLFPRLTAVLNLVPMSARRRPLTQVGISGHYVPPFGMLGSAGDLIAGTDIAAESGARFVSDVARRLESLISETDAGPEEQPAIPPADDSPHRRILIPVDHLGDREGGGAGVERQVGATPGVYRADVNPISGMVSLDYNPDVCDLAALLAVIDADGPAW